MGSWPFALFCLGFGLIGLRLCWKAFKQPDWVFGADLVPMLFCSRRASRWPAACSLCYCWVANKMQRCVAADMGASNRRCG